MQPVDEQPLVLTQFPPAWTLPSSCPRSIAIQLYCQFAGLSVQILDSKYPYSSVTGSLPTLRQGKHVYGSEDILLQLKQCKDVDTGADISKEKRCDISAYIALVEEHLYPAWLYMLWKVDKNYHEVTHANYARDVSFPLHYFLPYQERRDVSKRLADRKVTNEKQARGILYRVLSTLSDRLGAQTYFMGSRPTSLDAVVAAHVAVLYHAPLPEGHISALIEDQFPNLKRHFQDICSRFTQYRPSTPAAALEVGSYWTPDPTSLSKERKKLETGKEYFHTLVFMGIVATAMVTVFIVSRLKGTENSDASEPRSPSEGSDEV